MVKLALLFLSTAAVSLAALEPNMMPMPAQYTFGTGRLPIGLNFLVGYHGQCDARVQHAIPRLYEQITRITGIEINTGLFGTAEILEITCETAGKPVQTLGEDESYSLEIDVQKANLRAATSLGALRGMETFAQLISQDHDGFSIPAITIKDRPRFPWRGLSLDVARHWMPVDVVKRTLDGMAAVKLNVFHWHLSDDQGFRVESKRFPKLHEMGSDGHFYTQAQVHEIMDYAHERGIRVVPEFDMPGHTTSWLVGYPELAAAPGPYLIERHWGVFDPCLDPTRETTYEFLDGFIAEMAGLFDDEYFHIGGDEVNGKQWKANAQIQTFMQENNLQDQAALHRYFNRRLQEIVKKHGKHMEGWDEILDPGLPKDIVIQSWRGQDSLNQAAKDGFSGLLSAGYYLDLMHSAEEHYSADPFNAAGMQMTDEQRARILGGEAAMWTEYATTANIDDRLWPRTAAIAERLWSPQSVRDVGSMYARLESVNRYLDILGLTHRESRRKMLERLAGNDPVRPVMVLADIVEPVKDYTRETLRDYAQFTPLNRLVDVAHPESEVGRILRFAIAMKDWGRVRRMLVEWRDNDALVRPTLQSHALLADALPLSANLSKVATIGLDALDRIEGHKLPDANWAAAERNTLTGFKKPVAEVLLMAVPGVETLVELAAGSAQ